MKKSKNILISGIILLLSFAVFTVLVLTVDVRAEGINGTDIGFSHINISFFNLTGVHMTVYTVTDWLSLVPLAVCLFFAVTGLVQLIKRKSLMKVDIDILLLGVYYILVMTAYIVFETVTVNYRPVLIEGCMEKSYPSSTTMLILSVMPTLNFQINRRLTKRRAKAVINTLSVLFSLFMVIARTICGVHWLTDIIGSVLLSFGLYCIYKGSVLYFENRRIFFTEAQNWNSAKNCRN